MIVGPKLQFYELSSGGIAFQWDTALKVYQCCAKECPILVRCAVEPFTINKFGSILP